eukprot:COSAG06_NODE_613_length_13796_cov_45.631525_6_plen_82_part_00
MGQKMCGFLPVEALVAGKAGDVLALLAAARGCRRVRSCVFQHKHTAAALSFNNLAVKKPTTLCRQDRFGTNERKTRKTRQN